MLGRRRSARQVVVNWFWTLISFLIPKRWKMWGGSKCPKCKNQHARVIRRWTKTYESGPRFRNEYVIRYRCSDCYHEWNEQIGSSLSSSARQVIVNWFWTLISFLIPKRWKMWEGNKCPKCKNQHVRVLRRWEKTYELGPRFLEEYVRYGCADCHYRWNEQVRSSLIGGF
jgi:transposase-like protein